MNGQSAVNFPGNSRIHIALAVTDVQRSRTFYETLFGVSPTKERVDYVKFEPQDPSVNLTLNQADVSSVAEQLIAHYGVQVKSTQAVQDAITRLTKAGLQTSIEENTTCCYAIQDKVWVSDPDGNRWEVFVVLEADTEPQQDKASSCCSTESTQSKTCC